MLYKPRKPQLVSAKRFPGEDFYQGFGRKAPYQGYCGTCGKLFSEHLLSNDGKTIVCPGSYIMYEGSQIINIMSEKNFEAIYEPLYTE